MCKCILISLTIVAFTIIIGNIQTTEDMELAQQAVECWKSEVLVHSRSSISEFDPLKDDILGKLPNTGDIQLDELILLNRKLYGKDVTTEKLNKFFNVLTNNLAYYIGVYRLNHISWKWKQHPTLKERSWILVDKFNNEITTDNRLINLDLDYTSMSGIVAYALDKAGISHEAIVHKLYMNIEPYAGCYETSLEPIGICNSTLRCGEWSHKARNTWIKAHAPTCPVKWKLSQLKDAVDFPKEDEVCMDYYEWDTF